MGWRVAVMVSALAGCGLGVDWSSFHAGSADAGTPSALDASVEAGAPVDAGADYASAVRASRPVAFYRFEETDGQPVVSDIPGAPDGAIRGDGAHVAGRIGRGISLDGDGLDRIVFGNAWGFMLDRERGFSVELLVEAKRLSDNYARIFSLEAGDDVQTGLSLFARDSELGFIRKDTGGTATMVAKQPAIPIGRFVHIVASCEGGSSCRLVVDGTGKSIVPGGTGAPPNVGPFSIGGRSLEGNNVRGVFDELAIYDHGLTDEEIAAHIAALP